MKKFKAVIEASDGGGGGAWVKVPFDVEKVFPKKRVPIVATIDGEPYRGTLVRMGTPHHILGVLKGIRQKIGKDVGDEVAVTLKEDTEERVVEVPQDLAAALKKNQQARAFFEKLSYTHQKEYVRWIEEAKKPETRTTRIAKAIALLAAARRSARTSRRVPARDGTTFCSPIAPTKQVRTSSGPLSRSSPAPSRSAR